MLADPSLQEQFASDEAYVRRISRPFEESL